MSNIKPEQLCFQSAVAFDSNYRKWSTVLFAARLISHGGHFVDIPPLAVPPMDVNTISGMLDSGDFFDGAIATSVSDDAPESELSDFVNAVADDPASFHLYAGYALFADGIWRLHDWLYNSDEDAIIDSVPPKSLYYGALISTGNLAVAAILISPDEEP